MDYGLSVHFKYRLCNRELAACLNMLQILFSVRNGNETPALFQREQQQ